MTRKFIFEKSFRQTVLLDSPFSQSHEGDIIIHELKRKTKGPLGTLRKFMIAGRIHDAMTDLRAYGNKSQQQRPCTWTETNVHSDSV